MERFSRREFLAATAALGAAAPFSRIASAQGKSLVAATFPGTWNEAHREILAPEFRKRSGASVTQTII
ncbi:MAG TPA: twin-arginine translocation signal domain-containing protein, partial [Burkholderiales bacterium]